MAVCTLYNNLTKTSPGGHQACAKLLILCSGA